MFLLPRGKTLNYFKKIVSLAVMLCFLALTLAPSIALAQSVAGLPIPGTLLSPTPSFTPLMLRGIQINPKNPFEFNFLVDTGTDSLKKDEIQKQSETIAKYFLSTVTIPEDDLWVNLSPYEQDRIAPDALSQTDMGRDLLAQDYILKQLTASLIHPDNEVGKIFWKKVYKKAYEEYGTTQIPVDTFNKVWIVPDKATVYQEGNRAFVAESSLRVMIEQDYLATTKHSQRSSDASVGVPTSDVDLKSDKEVGSSGKVMVEEDYVALEKNKEDVPILTAGSQSKRNEFAQADLMSADGLHKSGAHSKTLNTKYQILDTVSFQIVREVLIPLLEKEVNEGKLFVQLRQMYHAMILATWYKQNLKNSIINKIYSDQSKVKGVETPDPEITQKIYDQYLEAYKKGVCDLVKVEYDQNTQKHVPRKYFSGGFDAGAISSSIKVSSSPSLRKTVVKSVAGLVFAVMFALSSAGNLQAQTSTTATTINSTRTAVDTIKIGLDGNLYSVDTTNHYIYMQDKNAQEMIVVGRYQNGSLDSGKVTVKDPNNIILGPDGNLYYLDELHGSDSLYVQDKNTQEWKIIDGVVEGRKGTAALYLYNPSRIMFGPDGNLYTLQEHDMTILMRDKMTGDWITVCDFIDDSFPYNKNLKGADGDPLMISDMQFGPDGNLYLTFRNESTIRMRNKNTGNMEVIYDVPFDPVYRYDTRTEDIEFRFGPEGELYVFFTYGSYVKRQEEEGEWSVILDENDMSIVREKIDFFRPSDIIFESDGSLRVIEESQNREWTRDKDTGEWMLLSDNQDDNAGQEEEESLIISEESPSAATISPESLASPEVKSRIDGDVSTIIQIPKIINGRSNDRTDTRNTLELIWRVLQSNGRKVYQVRGEWVEVAKSKSDYDEKGLRAKIEPKDYTVDKDGKVAIDPELSLINFKKDLAPIRIRKESTDGETYYRDGKSNSMSTQNDKAGASSSVGGIDLNANLLDLKTQGVDMDFELPLEWQNVDFDQVPGLVPVFIQITPVMNFPAFVAGEQEIVNPENHTMLSMQTDRSFPLYIKE